MARKKISFVAAVVALGLPATAVAQTRHSCKPALRSDLAVSANAAVTCNQAQAVERFMNTHETADLAFNAGKREWLGTIYSRAHGHTYFVFVSPAKQIGIVWVTVRLPVS